MDSVVQQNASASEELASTAEELEGQARHLGDTIRFFKQADGAARAASVLHKEPTPRKDAIKAPSPKALIAETSAAGNVTAKQREVVPVSKASDVKDTDFEEF
jgi:methyl-accepting chemotaxis protein